MSLTFGNPYKKAKKVFICSPYRENDTCTVDKHIKLAKALSWTITLAGFIPVTPHLYFTQFLDDNIKAERKAGMEAGKRQLEECDIVLAYAQCCGISEGMKAEIKLAKKLKKPYIVQKELTIDGKLMTVEDLSQKTTINFYRDLLGEV